jgi:hypothetical protein
MYFDSHSNFNSTRDRTRNVVLGPIFLKTKFDYGGLENQI